MSKRKTNEFINMLFCIVFLISFIGFKDTIQLIYETLKNINIITIKLFSSSVLSIIFKYFITFPIVGIILVKINVSKGKTGHYIGKILYFIIGYIVAFLLDVCAKIIF